MKNFKKTLIILIMITSISNGNEFESEKKVTNINSLFGKTAIKASNVNKLKKIKAIMGNSKNYRSKRTKSYMTKIFKRINKRWAKGLVFQESHETYVELTINKNGNMKFKILEESLNKNFDKHIIQILKEEQKKPFPRQSISDNLQLEVLFKNHHIIK